MVVLQLKQMEKLALLIVDFQTGLVKEQPYNLPKVVENLKTLIKGCREKAIEIIYLQHNDPPGEGLEKNTKNWEIYPAIAPLPTEMIFEKNYNSGFKETGLKEYLWSKRIGTLVITGMQTDYCVDATIKVAFEFGFKVIIPENTNTTIDNARIKASQLYEYYNYHVFHNRYGVVESMTETLKRLIAR